jgi:hypothetical protein
VTALDPNDERIPAHLRARMPQPAPPPMPESAADSIDRYILTLTADDGDNIVIRVLVDELRRLADLIRHDERAADEYRAGLARLQAGIATHVSCVNSNHNRATAVQRAIDQLRRDQP